MMLGNADPQIHVTGLLGLADARYRLDDEEGALQAWISATQAPEITCGHPEHRQEDSNG